MQKDMIYAPVIIPTLNRVTHLKRCLESLLANGWAKYTDVYVSVDFPPAEKYEEGYRQVKEYLNSADFSGFQSMNVVFQEKNLGPGGNSDFLESWIRPEHDCFIYTEDDNEFAPNALEYLDKGLTLFRDNPQILGICAAKDTDWETHGKSVLLGKIGAVYGFATWFEKNENAKQQANALLLSKKSYTLKNLLKFRKKSGYLFCMYIMTILCSQKNVFWKADGTLNFCDSVRSIYMHLTDTYCILPAVAKARTWGNDGSGANMGKRASSGAEFTLDSATAFSYPDTLSFAEENYALGDRYLWNAMDSKLKTYTKAFLYYIILLLHGKNREKTVNTIENMYRFLQRK